MIKTKNSEKKNGQNKNGQDKNGKIRQKYPYVVTRITQHPLKLQRFPKWHMKDNGCKYFF